MVKLVVCVPIASLTTKHYDLCIYYWRHHEGNTYFSCFKECFIFSLIVNLMETSDTSFLRNCFPDICSSLVVTPPSPLYNYFSINSILHQLLNLEEYLDDVYVLA